MQKLAAALEKRWTPADGIAPWLRRNGPRLRRMVRDGGWTWADIGRAMTLAGITYASGTPWTEALLNVKLAQARNHLRTRDAKRTGGDRHDGPGVQTAIGKGRKTTRLPLDISGEATAIDSTPEPEPSFALATLASTQFTPPAPTDDAGTSSKPSSARKRVDVDEVIRRLQGGGAPHDSKD